MRTALVVLILAAAVAFLAYSPRDDRIALEIRDNLTVRIPLDVWEPKR